MSQEKARRRSMVGWYDPRVLVHSAYQVAIANVFGRHSDTRLIEALASQPQNEFDYSTTPATAPGDFWFDYTADIGDGWNSTFAIADAIAQPTLDQDGRIIAGKVFKGQQEVGVSRLVLRLIALPMSRSTSASTANGG